MDEKYGRVAEWSEFFEICKAHIRDYTVPQYGDMDLENPEKGDQMQSATLEDIQMNLRRYVNRMNSNARGKEEAVRDLVKIAHYACILWGKYNRGEIDINTELKETYTIESLAQLEAMVSALKSEWPNNETIVLKFK